MLITRTQFNELESKMYDAYCNGGQFDTLTWVALNELGIDVEGLDTSLMLTYHGLPKKKNV